MTQFSKAFMQGGPADGNYYEFMDDGTNVVTFRGEAYRNSGRLTDDGKHQVWVYDAKLSETTRGAQPIISKLGNDGVRDDSKIAVTITRSEHGYWSLLINGLEVDRRAEVRNRLEAEGWMREFVEGEATLTGVE